MRYRCFMRYTGHPSKIFCGCISSALDMDGATPPHALLGAWLSTEAFGNTSLDWSQALKDRKARLVVEFRSDGSYLFCMQTASGDEITDQFRHIVARKGKFTADNSSIVIEGDGTCPMDT
jgi:hypothetical protein